jgi:hypothetical protein
MATKLKNKDIPAHLWEPDFSNGEPEINSKTCGFCGLSHSENWFWLDDVEDNEDEEQF